jgi:membrane protein implicated in regulation of membrane protease activity
VRNPFKSEAEAFQLVLLALGYFGLIIIAAAIDRWVGVAVFAVLTVVAVLWIVRARREPPVRRAPQQQSAPGERRILVIANETVGGESLREEIRRRAEDYDERVRVICPAVMSAVKFFASDEDAARAKAQDRLDHSLSRLREIGVNCEGEVGDADPLQAIEDALRTFGADEIIISTHPEGRSHWLERGVVRGARERFDVPITHVVVDLEAEREEVPTPAEGLSRPSS